MNGALGLFLQTRLFRFLTVGVGAALLLFVLSWLLVSLGLSPFVGSVTAYAISFVVAYSAQRSWTFGGKHDHATAMPRYLALQVGCAVFSGLVSHVAATRFAMPPHMGKPASSHSLLFSSSLFSSSRYRLQVPSPTA